MYIYVYMAFNNLTKFCTLFLQAHPIAVQFMKICLKLKIT